MQRYAVKMGQGEPDILHDDDVDFGRDGIVMYFDIF